MTKTVQDIFNRLREKKQQAKIINRKYKEELIANGEYQRIREDMEKLKAKRKAHEDSVREQATFARIAELKLAIQQDTQMLSDVALTSIMKGEPLQVKDQYKEYEPVFTVRFRKIP